jgi:hypothetical protein
MRMNETERNLIIMKCDAGEYKVCVWTFTGESLSFFLSAIYPRQKGSYSLTVEMTLCCVRIMQVLQVLHGYMSTFCG